MKNEVATRNGMIEQMPLLPANFMEKYIYPYVVKIIDREHMSQVNDLSYLFDDEKCNHRTESFRNEGLSHWTMPCFRNFNDLFEQGSQVTEGFNEDFLYWTMEDQIKFSQMFSYCDEVNIDVSNWNVTNMKDMIYEKYEDIFIWEYLSGHNE